MKKIVLFCFALYFAVLSCTKEKTDYEVEIDQTVPEYIEFKEAYSFESDRYRITIEALNGTFYKGYNEIRLKITNSQTNEKVNTSAVTFLPIKTETDGSHASCPHSYQLFDRSEEKYFSGYAVFTGESTTETSWDLYISFEVGNKTHLLKHRITVEHQKNKNLNMAAFTGADGKQYVIALIAPQKPSVGENQLIAGIYKYEKPSGVSSSNFPDASQFSYSEVEDYSLQLDPRMPEPSMGNHSSPNNKDLSQQNDGLYHGVVNYTMTGNWTLNFIMSNKQGKILKGTVVPSDFTPGVVGKKSELFIDILF